MYSFLVFAFGYNFSDFFFFVVLLIVAFYLFWWVQLLTTALRVLTTALDNFSHYLVFLVLAFSYNWADFSFFILLIIAFN